MAGICTPDVLAASKSSLPAHPVPLESLEAADAAVNVESVDNVDDGAFLRAAEAGSVQSAADHLLEQDGAGRPGHDQALHTWCIETI
jgi:hypothetical protein